MINQATDLQDAQDLTGSSSQTLCHAAERARSCRRSVYELISSSGSAYQSVPPIAEHVAVDRLQTHVHTRRCESARSRTHGDVRGSSDSGSARWRRRELELLRYRRTDVALTQVRTDHPEDQSMWWLPERYLLLHRALNRHAFSRCTGLADTIGQTTLHRSWSTQAEHRAPVRQGHL
jgi:hypothetical protein